MDSLKGSNLVNDNALIAFIGTELAKTNITACVFAPQFFDVLKSRGFNSAIRRHAATEKRLKRPIWIIPGNTMGGMHWVLVVVIFRKKVIALNRPGNHKNRTQTATGIHGRISSRNSYALGRMEVSVPGRCPDAKGWLELWHLRVSLCTQSADRRANE